MVFTVLSSILLLGWSIMFALYLVDKFTPTKFLTSVMFVGIILNIFTELVKHLK